VDVAFERSAARIWKGLTREERVRAARYFWNDPAPDAHAAAQSALVKALRVRPQAVRTLPLESKVQGLAVAMQPVEVVAAALLVALHLGERRELLTAFIDAVGLPHHEGLMPEDAPGGAVGESAARAGYDAIAGRFPEEHVRTYLNTIWLQDHERWEVLEAVVFGDGKASQQA
jgi:hypothetical protein